MPISSFSRLTAASSTTPPDADANNRHWSTSPDCDIFPMRVAAKAFHLLPLKYKNTESPV